MPAPKPANGTVPGVNGQNEGNEKAGAKVALSSQLPVSQPFVPGLAHQISGGSPQPRHARSKLGQFPQGQRFLGADGGREVRHRLAATGDEHLFAGFHLGQKFAKARFCLSQSDGDQNSLKWS